MRLTGLLACVPVLAIIVATGCADGPLENVRPVKYVKIEDANATTTKDPPPTSPTTKREPATDEKPQAATTSAASSTSETMQPDELINQASGAGKKPAGKGGKPAKGIGASAPKTPDKLTDEKCFRVGKDCCGDLVEGVPQAGKNGLKECPKGSVPGGNCPKKRCKST